jgi:hypothetical protein
MTFVIQLVKDGKRELMENRNSMVTESKSRLTRRLYRRHLTLHKGDPLPVTRDEFDQLNDFEDRPDPGYPEIPYLFGRMVVVFEW